jgi:hypothetical protein
MLKLLLLIDCDECGYPLSQATVCCTRDPLQWDRTIEAMMFEAAEKGWSFYHKYCRCPRCGNEQTVEATIVQQMMQEEPGESAAT